MRIKKKSKNVDLYFIFDLYPKYEDISKLNIRIKLFSNIGKKICNRKYVRYFERIKMTQEKSEDKEFPNFQLYEINAAAEKKIAYIRGHQFRLVLLDIVVFVYKFS